MFKRGLNKLTEGFIKLSHCYNFWRSKTENNLSFRSQLSIELFLATENLGARTMYENEKLKNLLGYGRGRFSSLWKIYTDDRVPEDFFELKLKYLGIIVDKGKNYLDMNKNEIRIKEFEEYNNAFATLSKLLGKMDKQRKSLMKNKYSRILLITLISFMFPELLLSQPLFCSIFRTNTLYQYKVLGLGA